MPDERDPLDEALQDALASYGRTPTNDGLERRILTRITGQSTRNRRIAPLALAMAAAAILLMTSLFWWRSKATMQTLPASTTATVLRRIEALPKATSPAVVRAAVPVRAVRSRKTPRARAEPKLPRFPTPSPLSDEERALVKLVTRYPNNVPQELTNFGGPIAPVEITALEIKPLQ